MKNIEETCHRSKIKGSIDLKREWLQITKVMRSRPSWAQMKYLWLRIPEEIFYREWLDTRPNNK